MNTPGSRTATGSSNLRSRWTAPCPRVSSCSISSSAAGAPDTLTSYCGPGVAAPPCHPSSTPT